MKHIITFATLIISVFSLFSQDRDPSPFRFNFQYDGKFYSDTCMSQEVFKQKKFVLGAQWGMHPRMGRALRMNVNQGVGSRLLDTDMTAEEINIWKSRLFSRYSAFLNKINFINKAKESLFSWISWIIFLKSNLYLNFGKRAQNFPELIRIFCLWFVN